MGHAEYTQLQPRYALLHLIADPFAFFSFLVIHLRALIPGHISLQEQQVYMLSHPVDFPESLFRLLFDVRICRTARRLIVL